MPRSFLITNRRYKRQVEAGVQEVTMTIVDSAGDSDLDLKPDDEPTYNRSSGSTGSSELDLISEPSDDSYLKDVANDTAIATGQSCYSAVFPALGSISAADVEPRTAFDASSYDSLVTSRQDNFHFTLFPELLSYIGAAKRVPEVGDLVLKDAYYKLDDNLNELVERSWDDETQVVGIDSMDLHVCPDCGKQYSTSSNLARHRQTHRGAPGERKSRKCPHCDKEYVSMPAYSMHVRTHNQGCACPHCGKRFSRPWLLQGHVRTHTGEKPFRCPQCAKTFADKSNLRAHIQTHSTEKPYVCGRCGKAFALKSYLYKHEESSCMRTSRFYDGLHERTH